MCAERLRLAIGRALLGAIAFALAGSALADELPEYRLKAAFLYNFAAFTEWPADAPATLTVCTYGGDPFGSDLDALAGKPVGTRTIAVQRRSGADSLRGCQIVFVAATAWDHWPKLQDTLRGQVVLTVADTAGAARAGVALNMMLAGGRVAFEANLDAARGARLNLSSKLLRLAKEVIQ